MVRIFVNGVDASDIPIVFRPPFPELSVFIRAKSTFELTCIVITNEMKKKNQNTLAIRIFDSMKMITQCVNMSLPDSWGLSLSRF